MPIDETPGPMSHLPVPAPGTRSLVAVTETGLVVALHEIQCEACALVGHPKPIHQTIHDAAGVGDIADLRAWLHQGCPVDLRDADESATPLHHAVRSGHLEATRILLENGADPNSVFFSYELGQEGPTGSWRALHEAAWTSSHESREGDSMCDLVELLLSYGAEVNAQDEEGSTAFEWVFGRTDVWDILIANGADVERAGQRAFSTALVDFDSDQFDYLLRHGVLPSLMVRHQSERTLLHDMALGNIDERHAPAFVRRCAGLLELGFSLGAVDVDGNSPLHVACGNLAAVPVQAFLALGADRSVTNRAGLTPLACVDAAIDRCRQQPFLPGFEALEANQERLAHTIRMLLGISSAK